MSARRSRHQRIKKRGAAVAALLMLVEVAAVGTFMRTDGVTRTIVTVCSTAEVRTTRVEYRINGVDNGTGKSVVYVLGPGGVEFDGLRRDAADVFAAIRPGVAYVIVSGQSAPVKSRVLRVDFAAIDARTSLHPEFCDTHTTG